jgi:diguanylate cyclase (GGDEF)-like protein/PAS domain S-box-containing protein
MSVRPLKMVLLVEDDRGDARLLREMLNAQLAPRLFDLKHVTCMREAETYLAEHAVDVILLDLGLPDAQGLEAVRQSHAVAPRIPLVVLSGLEDDLLSISALQAGAQDYLVKGQIEARGLLRALRYAIERRVMEEALFAERERAQVTLNSIGDAVMCTDISGNITFLNAVAERVTGWSSLEAIGQPIADVFRILEALTGVSTSDPMQLTTLPETAHLPSSCLLIRRDGVAIPIEDSIAPIHNREGETTGSVVVFRDMSATRAMSLMMTHTAEHDFLTGLPNRMLLNDRVNQAISFARRHRRQLALLFLDLDGFKHINDSLGHSIGDKLLQSVARRLVDCARASDTVSRQGGDEFVVLLSEMEHAEDAAFAAHRILSSVAETHLIGDHDLHVTTSIGVSVYPDDGIDAETLIKNADTAMYQAKEHGRHSYQYFKPAMNARAVERQFIEEALRRALERRELALHYQPKIDFKTGSITGAEALLRWTHPTRGALSPAQFIPWRRTAV